MQTQFKNFTIIYFFNSSKFSFSNEITINTINEVKALQEAKKEVSFCYGSKMLKKFTFKLKN
jgi:hypothetical protein